MNLWYLWAPPCNIEESEIFNEYNAENSRRNMTIHNYHPLQLPSFQNLDKHIKCKVLVLFWLWVL